MKSYILARIIVSVVLIFGFFSQASAVVDQENVPGQYYTYLFPSGGGSWQQEVAVGINGRLTGIDLFYQQIAPWLDGKLAFNFSINRGDGWQIDANDWSTNIITDTSPIHIDLSASNFIFSAGERFVFGIGRAVGGSACCMLLVTGESYAGRMWSSNGIGYQQLNQDFGFRTYVSAVPEPAKFASLLAGTFAILIYFLIRQRRYIAAMARGAP